MRSVQTPLLLPSPPSHSLFFALAMSAELRNLETFACHEQQLELHFASYGQVPVKDARSGVSYNVTETTTLLRSADAMAAVYIPINT